MSPNLHAGVHREIIVTERIGLIAPTDSDLWVDFVFEMDRRREIGEGESEKRAKRPFIPKALLVDDLPDDLASWFWDRMHVGEPDDCWTWKSAKEGCYGSVYLRGLGQVRAHKVAYVLAMQKDVEAGLIMLHSCDNRPCCNPGHVRPGTFRENFDDMVKKGRGKPFGSEYPVL